MPTPHHGRGPRPARGDSRAHTGVQLAALSRSGAHRNHRIRPGHRPCSGVDHGEHSFLHPGVVRRAPGLRRTGDRPRRKHLQQRRRLPGGTDLLGELLRGPELLAPISASQLRRGRRGRRGRHPRRGPALRRRPPSGTSKGRSRRPGQARRGRASVACRRRARGRGSARALGGSSRRAPPYAPRPR